MHYKGSVPSFFWFFCLLALTSGCGRPVSSILNSSGVEQHTTAAPSLGLLADLLRQQGEDHLAELILQMPASGEAAAMAQTFFVQQANSLRPLLQKIISDPRLLRDTHQLVISGALVDLLVIAKHNPERWMSLQSLLLDSDFYKLLGQLDGQDWQSLVDQGIISVFQQTPLQAIKENGGLIIWWAEWLAKNPQAAKQWLYPLDCQANGGDSGESRSLIDLIMPEISALQTSAGRLLPILLAGYRAYCPHRVPLDALYWDGMLEVSLPLAQSVGHKGLRDILAMPSESLAQVVPPMIRWFSGNFARQPLALQNLQTMRWEGVHWGRLVDLFQNVSAPSLLFFHKAAQQTVAKLALQHPLQWPQAAAQLTEYWYPKGQWIMPQMNPHQWKSFLVTAEKLITMVAPGTIAAPITPIDQVTFPSQVSQLPTPMAKHPDCQQLVGAPLGERLRSLGGCLGLPTAFVSGLQAAGWQKSWSQKPFFDAWLILRAHHWDATHWPIFEQLWNALAPVWNIHGSILGQLGALIKPGDEQWLAKVFQEASRGLKTLPPGLSLKKEQLSEYRRAIGETKATGLVDTVMAESLDAKLVFEFAQFLLAETSAQSYRGGLSGLEQLFSIVRAGDVDLLGTRPATFLLSKLQDKGEELRRDPETSPVPPVLAEIKAWVRWLAQRSPLFGDRLAILVKHEDYWEQAWRRGSLAYVGHLLIMARHHPRLNLDLLMDFFHGLDSGRGDFFVNNLGQISTVDLVRALRLLDSMWGSDWAAAVVKAGPAWNVSFAKPLQLLSLMKLLPLETRRHLLKHNLGSLPPGWIWLISLVHQQPELAESVSGWTSRLTPAHFEGLKNWQLSVTEAKSITQHWQPEVIAPFFETPQFLEASQLISGLPWQDTEFVRALGLVIETLLDPKSTLHQDIRQIGRLMP